MHNFVLLSFQTNPIMSSMSPSLDFLHLALSRPSVPIISLLMQLISHEYMLYVTYVTSNIVSQHPMLDASKNVSIPIVSEFDEIRRVS